MKEYKELVEILTSNGVVQEENGIKFIYKQSPDGQPGYLDRREAVIGSIVKEELEKNPENYPKNIVDNYASMFPQITEEDSYVFEGMPIGAMRKTMGWKSIDLSSHIITEEISVKGEVEIPVRIYRPDSERGGRPCLIFFHGGGFIGGSMDVVENPCKSIAEKADAVVVSVDYRLAPENPYPKGMEDCYRVVQWVWETSDVLGVDKEKIGVAGDSAGGNLAAVMAMRDRDENGGKIHYQALLYATLMRGEGEEYPGYSWNLDMYHNKENNPYISGACTWIKDAGGMLDITYVQGNNKKEPYISPLDAADFARLPKTLIATAEYDFLRAQCDLYGKRLEDSGVLVRNVRYGGVVHAFLDKYGFLPQAEDCVNEIVNDLKNL